MGVINHFKTVLLLGALTGLLLWVGQAVGGAGGLTFAIAIVLIMNVGTYFFSDKIVLKMHHAIEVEKDHHLYKMVDRLRKKAHLPMPKVYRLPTGTPNAFATGRNPNHAAVAATDGILSLLNEDELEGVIAHELTHVKNRDTLIATIAASVAGIISYVAMMARWAAIFGGMGGDDRNGNPFEFIVLALLTPLIASLIQFAISRSREYLADEGGAKISGKPQALASALKKIHNGIAHHPMKPSSNNKATASLFIENPFRGENLMNLFSTHPPMKKRVARLEAMK